MSKEMLQNALEYIRMGISIIPLLPRSKQPHFERLAQTGYQNSNGQGAWEKAQRQIATEAIVTQWFSNNNAGIALVGGSVSHNLIYLDFDDPESYKSWGIQHKEIVNRTAVQKTVQGYHVFFRCKETKGGKLYWQSKPVGEIRGEGMYVVCPPSIHPKGICYKWLRHPNAGVVSIDSLETVNINQPVSVIPSPFVGFRGKKNEIDRAKEMLSKLDPWRREDYDAWLRVGMSLTSLGDAGLELWHEWSAANKKYDARILDRKWVSFMKGDGLTLGSLYYWTTEDNGAIQQSKWKTL